MSVILKVQLSLFILFFAQSVCLKAQLAPIPTDRPGQAINPYVVGRKILQTQTGIDVNRIQYDNINSKSTGLALNTTIRFGITKFLEINSSWEYRGDNFNMGDLEMDSRGLSFSTIGTRVTIFDENKSRPALGVQFTFKLPILSEPYDFGYLAPGILLTASKNISEKVSLTVNLGADYNGNNPQPSGVYVANLGYVLNDYWSLFIENYGNFTTEHFENSWDAGVGYLLNDNLKLDLFGGVGYNDNVLNYFISIGVSQRFIAWAD